MLRTENRDNKACRVTENRDNKAYRRIEDRNEKACRGLKIGMRKLIGKLEG